jgi:hypothetical protein
LLLNRSVEDSEVSIRETKAVVGFEVLMGEVSIIRVLAFDTIEVSGVEWSRVESSIFVVDEVEVVKI